MTMWSLLLACAAAPDDSGAQSPAADSGGAPDSLPGQDDAVVFARDVLHEVALELAPEDWAALRVQERNFYEFFGEDCMAGPWGSPYTWFRADATVDGQALGPVGVRKKGLLGSVTPDRPSFRLDFDHEVSGVRLHGLEKVVLNNGRQDPSRLRTCLAHDWFADAGLVAPRCALAHVVVNGEDLGVYALTEAIDEDLVRRVEGVAPGALYEGTLSDFREGWLATFEAEGEGDGRELQAVVDALEADDDTVLAALDAVIDVDAFLRFWAAESFAGHWDGHTGNTNNFYVYANGTDGRLRFVASGPDAVWDSRQPFGAGAPIWVTTTAALANRLIRVPEGKARFEAELQRLVDEVWAEDERLARVDADKELLREVSDSTQRTAIAELRDMVEVRAGDVEAVLGARVEPADLRNELCWTDVGSVTVDFRGTFGSYPDGDLFTGGEATPTYLLADVEYPALESGVSVGWEGAAGGKVLWLTISRIAEDTYLAPYVTFLPGLAVPGADIALDGVAATGSLLLNSPDTGGQWTTAAYLGNGTLHLDEADTVGGPWSGRLDVKVLGSE